MSPTVTPVSQQGNYHWTRDTWYYPRMANWHHFAIAAISGVISQPANTVKNGGSSQIFAEQSLQTVHAFDGLVSVHSSEYSGIFQDLNTKELAKKCHSITLLVTTASKTGATQSLHTAETPLKLEADSDLCYINTYMRKYSMKYISVAGVICHEIRMRDCHLIIGQDNFVMLIFHPDAMPGQSRSHQVNTLPITIFRVPTDAYITLSIHGIRSIVMALKSAVAWICSRWSRISETCDHRTQICQKGCPRAIKQYQHLILFIIIWI